MKNEGLQLIEPTLDFRDEFAACCREFADKNDVHGVGSMFTSDDFATAVGTCHDHSRGINVRSGWVPTTTFWLVRDGSTILGTASLRHQLNDYLEKFGGHIGYSVRPGEQRKGYATRMLAEVLKRARDLGLVRALITCDKHNIGSARVIQKNGGVLQDELPSPHQAGELTQRYWIAID